ncbi:uncharacterized protein J3R85_008035 [Psidium guajava]|nr:uncharacterized protein J3R85_008035 [Psidium guajava]
MNELTQDFSCASQMQPICNYNGVSDRTTRFKYLKSIAELDWRWWCCFPIFIFLLGSLSGG